MTKEFKIHLGMGVDKSRLMLEASSNLRKLLKGLIDAGAEKVVLTEGDPYLWQSFLNIRQLRKLKVSFIVLREKGQAKNPTVRIFQTAAKRFLRQLVRRLSRANVFVLKPSHTPLSKKYWIPDPITFRHNTELAFQMRTKWNLNSDLKTENVTWVGVLGSIGPRKNVQLIAQSLKPLKNVGLVIAGPGEIEEHIISSWYSDLQASGGLVYRDNRALTNEELDATILALDAVAVIHSNEAPSGIFGKALCAGTLVLASGSRLLRTLAKSAPNNAVWVPMNQQSISEAVAKLQVLPRPLGLQTTDAFFCSMVLQPFEEPI